MGIMARNVFRPGEVAVSVARVVLEAPFKAAVAEEPEELDIEAYAGPTADELRREAEAFKERWNIERGEMMQAAETEAAAIIASAKQLAAEEDEKTEAGREELRRKAEDEGAEIIAAAQRKAEGIAAESQAVFEAAKKTAEDEGRAAGREAGFAEGKAEVERLVGRAATMLERIQDKRAEIMEEAERQIVDLVLLITRKVIKTISETQRETVILNIKEALRKVKSRGKITVKVNIADLNLSTEHTDEFIRLVEGSGAIEIHEDSSVDRGGCIVETDFGEVDARIASQLSELETKILEISPVKS
jgi:flagellar assembly protein FliH